MGIKAFEIHKNPGPGVPIELIIKGCDAIIPSLHCIYNLFMNNQYLPKTIEIKCIKPIIKPTKNIHI